MLIEQAFLIGLTTVTSLAAYALAIGRLGLAARRLATAVLFVFQVVGMSTLFFLANLAIGLICVLVVRGATGQFVSVYLLNDPTLCVLSALQGACFECWRAGVGKN
jgi:hypothetical protein